MTIAPPESLSSSKNTPGPVQSRLWSAFDQIYCITLATRPDRLASARAQFRRVGLSGLVQFRIVDKHPTDSERGIFESHMSCLRAGLAAGADKILIFEDDILFSRFSADTLGSAIRFMQSNDDWKLFFLGCFVNSSRKTRHRAVIKIDYRCTAHAYVVSRRFAQELVQIPFQNVPFDDLLRKLSFGYVYALYPGIAFQSSSATDNDKLIGVDRARRFFGGFRRLQLWNEFSSRRFVPLVVAHFALLAILVLALLARYGRLHK